MHCYGRRLARFPSETRSRTRTIFRRPAWTLVVQRTYLAVCRRVSARSEPATPTCREEVDIADYVLRFTIPQQRQGEREQYRAFTTTLRQLTQMKGKKQSNCSVDSVEVTSGSVRGRAAISAPSVQEA